MGLREQNIVYLNKIDFEPYLSRHRDIYCVEWDAESDYSDKEVLANEVLCGHLIPYLTIIEFAKYLEQRYPAYEFDISNYSYKRKIEETDEEGTH